MEQNEDAGIKKEGPVETGPESHEKNSITATLPILSGGCCDTRLILEKSPEVRL
jgi:hypothetical protein